MLAKEGMTLLFKCKRNTNISGAVPFKKINLYCNVPCTFKNQYQIAKHTLLLPSTHLLYARAQKQLRKWKSCFFPSTQIC